MGEAWNNQLVSLIIITAGGGFTGLFMYSPSPGPGNLVTSIAPVAGVDPFGNHYPSGVNVGKPTGVQANLGVNASGVGTLQFLLNDPRFSSPEMIGSITGTPPFADIAIVGPQSTNASFDDLVTLALNSSDAVSSSANLIGFYTSTANIVYTMFTIDALGVGIRACGQLTATDPTTGTGPGNPASSETWHDMRPLLNSFVGTVAGQPPLQYRKCADGDVQIFGIVRTPPTTGNYNSIGYATLATQYRPNKIVRSFAANVTDGTSTPVMTVNTNGVLTFNYLPTSLAQTDIFVNCRFPLDNTGLIQS